MSLVSAIYLGIAMAYGTVAVLLWMQALPTMKRRRGPLQVLSIWLLGMAMGLPITGRLNLALMGGPLSWSLVAGDICLIGFGICELLRARQMGIHRWSQCPGGAS